MSEKKNNKGILEYIIKKFNKKIKTYEDDEKGNNKKNEILENWKELQKKWQSCNKEDYGKLLNLYTSLIENKNDIHDEYITHFLESTSVSFGYSRCGNSSHYVIYKDKSGPNYIFQNQEINGKKAETAFKDNIFKLFEQLMNPEINKDNIESYITKVNGENNELVADYPAKQIIRKAILLNLYDNDLFKTYPLLQIYRNDKIEKWYNFFNEAENRTIDKETDYYKMNNFIAKSFLKKINENLESEYSLSIPTITCMSHILWSESSDFELSINSPNLILYGAPGTGKTYAVRNYLRLRGIPAECTEMVQFHPNYSYEDFIEGIKPCGINDNGQIQFGVVNGIFKNFCIKAKNDPNNDYYFIVDEINRANLNAVFGETLSLLEADKRHPVKQKSKPDENNDINNNDKYLITTPLSPLIKKLNSKNKSADDKDNYYVIDGEPKFGIPDNIYFIGMMNDVDKSIDTFDLALRRRFRWQKMECDYDVILNHLVNNRITENTEEYIKSCNRLNNYICKSETIKVKVKDKNYVSFEGLGLGESYAFGHSFFMKITEFTTFTTKKITPTACNKLFNYYLLTTLKEYLRSFYSSEQEIDEKIENARKIFCFLDV